MQGKLIVLFIIIVAGRKPPYIIETEDGELHGVPRKLTPFHFQRIYSKKIGTPRKLEFDTDFCINDSKKGCGL